jgi:hypothetical protein
MIKKWTQYISEDVDDNISSDSNEYKELKDEIKKMVEKTVENNGGEYQSFIDSYSTSPEDYQIEGLINDSDIYDFYLKYRNEIDELLNDINFFDEVPSENNSYSLYEYVINGTKRTVDEIVEIL